MHDFNKKQAQLLSPTSAASRPSSLLGPVTCVFVVDGNAQDRSSKLLDFVACKCDWVFQQELFRHSITFCLELAPSNLAVRRVTKEIAITSPFPFS